MKKNNNLDNFNDLKLFAQHCMMMFVEKQIDSYPEISSYDLFLITQVLKKFDNTNFTATYNKEHFISIANYCMIELAMMKNNKQIPTPSDLNKINKILNNFK